MLDLEILVSLSFYCFLFSFQFLICFVKIYRLQPRVLFIYLFCLFFFSFKSFFLFKFALPLIHVQLHYIISLCSDTFAHAFVLFRSFTRSDSVHHSFNFMFFFSSFFAYSLFLLVSLHVFAFHQKNIYCLCILDFDFKCLSFNVSGEKNNHLSLQIVCI